MQVKSERMKHAVLSALADPEMSSILRAVMHSPKSATEIVREGNISQTTCYRKIKWLLDEGLLVTDRIELTPEGKKYSVFKGVLKSINVTFEFESDISINCEWIANNADDTAERVFFSDH